MTLFRYVRGDARTAVLVVALASTACASDAAMSGPPVDELAVFRWNPEPKYEERIRRVADDSLESFLITVAESHYPARDSIERVVRSVRQRLEERLGRRLERPLMTFPPVGEPVWWYTTFDRIRVPFAITGDAVAYYQRVLAANREGRPFPESGIHNRIVELSYTAEAAHHDVFRRESFEFREVYVVDMRLDWGNACGSLCGLFFSREQQVVLTREGEVLHVFGWDTGYIVS